MTALDCAHAILKAALEATTSAQLDAEIVRLIGQVPCGHCGRSAADPPDAIPGQ